MRPYFGERIDGGEGARACVPGGKAQDGELDVWNQFQVSSPVGMGASTKGVVDTRRALTREEAEGKKTAKARLVAKGCQYPDQRDGNVDIAGFAGRRSSHFHSISLGALKRWKIWSRGTENAFFRAHGFDRSAKMVSQRYSPHSEIEGAGTWP